MVRRRTAAFFFVVLAFCGVLTAAQSKSPLTLDEYRKALDDLHSGAARLKDHPEEAAELIKRIPLAWSVRSENQSFEIPGDGVQDRLRQFQTDSDPEHLKAFQQHISRLRAEAEGFTRPQ